MNIQEVLRQAQQLLLKGSIDDVSKLDACLEEICKQISASSHGSSSTTTTRRSNSSAATSVQIQNFFYIKEFCEVYLLLLDRLFGDDVCPKASSISNQANSQANAARNQLASPTTPAGAGTATASSGGVIINSSGGNWKAGAAGGWLKQLMSSRLSSHHYHSSNYGVDTQRPSYRSGSGRPQGFGGSRSSNRLSYSQLDNQYPVLSRGGQDVNEFDSLLPHTAAFIRRFCVSSGLLELIMRLDQGFEFNLMLIPENLRMFIINHPAYDAIQSNSHNKLCHRLLKHPLHSSLQRTNLQQNHALLVDALEYLLLCMVRYPTLSHDCLMKAPSFQSAAGSSSDFQTAAGIDGRNLPPVQLLHYFGAHGWISGVPFLVLLEQYLCVFFPCGKFHADAEDSSLQRYRELFIQLVLVYWIDVAKLLRYEHFKAQHYRKLLMNPGAPSIHGAMTTSAVGVMGSTDMIDHGETNYIEETDHPLPTEVVLLDQHSSLRRWTTASMMCTYMLLLRVLCDPSLLQQVQSVADADLRDASSDTMIGGMRSRRGLRGQQSSAAQPVAESYDWLQIQQPLFDMLRTIFAHGDLPILDRQMVALAIEVWLLYIQPWTASAQIHPQTRRQRSGGVLHLTKENPYSPNNLHWRPYIAANLHFYTTLLASYLQMVSKMNLNMKDAEGSTQVYMLERVCQVFSAPLVAAIDELSIGFSHIYIQQLSDPNAAAEILAHRTHDAPAQSDDWEYINISRSYSNAQFCAIAAADDNYRPTLQHTPFTSSKRSFQALVPLSSSDDAIEGATQQVVSNMEVKMNDVEYCLARRQHHHLYPDRRIDDLNDCGITDFRRYSETCCAATISSLHHIQIEIIHLQDEWRKFYYFITNNLRKVVGLAPVGGYKSKRWHRLEFCKVNLVRLVPSLSRRGMMPVSPTGDADKEAQGIEMRDLFTGKLTMKGRQELLNGNLRCQVQDVLHPRVLSTDPLLAPYCSYEWSVLVVPLIRISKVLNNFYGLPLDPRWKLHTWSSIFEHSDSLLYSYHIDNIDPQHESLLWAYLFSPGRREWSRSFLSLSVRCYRFNLRFIASFRVFASLLLFMVTGLLYCGLIVNKLFLTVAVAPLLYFMYQGSFPFSTTSW